MTFRDWLSLGEWIGVLMMFSLWIGAKRDAASARRLARDVLIMAATTPQAEDERRARFESECG